MKRWIAAICAVVALSVSPAVAVRRAVVPATPAEGLSAVPGGPSRAALDAALAAYASAAAQGAIARPNLLTVIDYTRPSTEPRLWVLDLAAGRMLYRELVAHGKNSGDNLTQHFSNASDSLMTSLGLFVTDEPYVGRNGYSLRLRGLDRGINDNALTRAIVMHGAAYVNGTIAAKLGRLGRSWGCPAVRSEIARELIDTIRGGSVIFAYGGSAS